MYYVYCTLYTYYVYRYYETIIFNFAVEKKLKIYMPIANQKKSHIFFSLDYRLYIIPISSHDDVIYRQLNISLSFGYYRNVFQLLLLSSVVTAHDKNHTLETFGQ